MHLPGGVSTDAGIRWTRAGGFVFDISAKILLKLSGSTAAIKAHTPLGAFSPIHTAGPYKPRRDAMCQTIKGLHETRMEPAEYKLEASTTCAVPPERGLVSR